MNKKIIYVLTAFVVLLGGGIYYYSTARRSSSAMPATVSSDYYTCSMHPSVHSDHPGVCPICGDKLVLASSLTKHTGDTVISTNVIVTSAERVLANIITAPAEQRTLEKTITGVGVIDYAEPLQAVVSARFRGRIEKLYVNYTGEEVQKGQPLFELYSPDLISAEQDYLLAYRSARVQGGDSAAHYLFDLSREKLRTHFGMTATQITGIEKSNIPRTSATFYSPIHGTVISKQVTEGMYVDEGMQLYQVADLSKVWANIDVYENDLRFVRTGEEVSITTEAYPNEIFKGKIVFIAPALDPQTRTVRVRVDLPNPRGLLKPQMYVRGAMHTAVPHALVVPASAVIVTGKRSVVWVETKQNTFEPRDVEIGARTDSLVQIVNGLSAGENVAVSGGYLLDSESELLHGSPADSGSTAPATKIDNMPGMNMNGGGK
ncbi:MAG TPA: efflux RND transporter periplasmic adaptor subunit [Candidatus Kapabacteria bacterium]|nr:efflux RND transporter periplasmic adaptor subunit [Candidatus Kapabacteria bacterium]